MGCSTTAGSRSCEALKGRWNELTAAFPQTPPAHAREPLRRALAMHARIGELLLTRRAAMLAELRARPGRPGRGGLRAQRGTGVSSIDHSA